MVLPRPRVQECFRYCEEWPPKPWRGLPVIFVGMEEHCSVISDAP